MALAIVDSIKAFLDADKSVRRVADDVELTAELILLVRMMFADGELKPAEMANFKRICATAFAIPEEDVPSVLNYLKDFGYSTTAAEAAAMFEELDIERKRALLVHMYSIAKSDEELHPDEAGLIRHTAEILGLKAEDLARLKPG